MTTETAAEGGAPGGASHGFPANTRLLIGACGGVFLAGVLLAGFAAQEKEGPKAGPKEEGATKFLRFVDLGGGEGQLESAIATYGRKDGVEVDLLSAVHVADAGYYATLQKRSEHYDCLLYEMIKPRDADPSPGEKSDNLLSAFQRGLKNILGLEFQLDALDYRKKNFVHADLDPDTFFRLQREKGESVLSLLWKAMRKEMELEASGKGPRSVGLLEILIAFGSEDSARALKMLLARQVEGMELIMAGFEEGKEDSGSVIVSERNKVVMKTVKKVLGEGKRRIGILYGGGHMPDLEKRLMGELGLEKRRTEWITAWDIRRKGKAAGLNQEGEKQGDRAPVKEPAGETEKNTESGQPRERQF